MAYCDFLNPCWCSNNSCINQSNFKVRFKAVVRDFDVAVFFYSSHGHKNKYFFNCKEIHNQNSSN